MEVVDTKKSVIVKLYNDVTTFVYGDGFIPISTLIDQCAGINVESVSMEYMDNGIKIVGTLVPRSPRGNGKESFSTRYLEARAKYLESRHQTSIYKKIIINPPATIVIWNDGTKTVVKATENDIYDPEKGVALCFLKKYFGSSYRKILKDANDIYEKKLEEDAELNNVDMGASLLKGFKDSMKEINNVARKLIDGGDK